MVFGLWTTVHGLWMVNCGSRFCGWWTAVHGLWAVYTLRAAELVHFLNGLFVYFFIFINFLEMISDNDFERWYLENNPKWSVYVLRCSDGTFYTGCSGEVKTRLKSHLNGEVAYTRSRLPVKLENTHNFKDKNMAFSFEKYLKSGSGKAFMVKRLVGLRAN